MGRKRRILLPILLLLLACAAPAEAAPLPAALPAGAFAVDPGRSAVRAFVRSTLHDFDVSVRVSRGELVLPARGSGAPVRIALDFPVREMDSGLFMRTEVMRSHVLEGGRFPVVRFRSEEVSFAGDGPGGSLRFRVRGRLRMHGVEKGVSVSAVVSVGGDRIEAEAKFPLRISDYRMEVPAPLPFLRTEDVVEVTARLVLRPKAP